jgi:hypothetical protein
LSEIRLVFKHEISSSNIQRQVVRDYAQFD